MKKTRLFNHFIGCNPSWSCADKKKTEEPKTPPAKRFWCFLTAINGGPSGYWYAGDPNVDTQHRDSLAAIRRQF